MVPAHSQTVAPQTDPRAILLERERAAGDASLSADRIAEPRHHEAADLDGASVRADPRRCVDVRPVLEPIAEALSALHQIGVVHRDVKPDNVFVLAGPAQPPRVKLIDFGLALIDSRTAARFTATGKLLGTAEYISPECARGGPASAASDVYALAMTAYELLCDELPFGGTGVELLLGKTREAVTQWQASLKASQSQAPGESDPDEVAKVTRKIDDARVKLAKEKK